MEGMPGVAGLPTLRMGSILLQGRLPETPLLQGSWCSCALLGPRSPSRCGSVPGWVRCWGWDGESKGPQASVPAPYPSQSHFAEGWDPVNIRELGCLAEHQLGLRRAVLGLSAAHGLTSGMPGPVPGMDLNPPMLGGPDRQQAQPRTVGSPAQDQASP